ncbi:MAG: hypothetical protein M3131_07110 [Actinomycetota bacterium]|nr:hypothetical protein [Actinomycetota bacterium]
MQRSSAPLALRTRSGDVVFGDAGGSSTIIATRTLVRALVAAAVICGAGLVGAANGLGATPSTPYDAVRVESPNPQAQGRWGERSALAGDIDGDGAGDFWLSAFQQSVGAAPLAGRVYLISGRTRSVIYSVAAPEPQSLQAFGFTVASPGDLNGDRRADLVVGAYGQDDVIGGAQYPNTGKAWAYDGATGALLYPLANPEPQSNPEQPFSKVFGFGTAISSAGDLNRDGRSEVIVGASSNDVPQGCGGQSPPETMPPAGCRRDQGQAFVFNGANGALLRTYNMPSNDQRLPSECNVDAPGPGIGTCGLFGQTVQGLGDTDGDGVTDHLVQGGTYGNNKAGRIWVFSGASGNLLFRIDNPAPTEVRIFGLQTVEPGAPGDVNGDGSADIYGNGFQHTLPSAPGAGPGRGWIFSGRDGSILYNLFDPSAEPNGGFAFSGANADYDLDGREDEFIAGQNGSGTAAGGGAAIFGVPTGFGPDAAGPALKDFEPPVEDRQPVGPPPANGLRFGRTVEAPGDLNGDCEPDFVIGAPHTDVGPNADQGRVYVFLSRVAQSSCPPRPTSPTRPAVAAFARCPSLTANVIRGNAAGGLITGTVAGDRIFGGTGNDVVDGLAGDDCIDLGPGTDRARGGLGNDLTLGGLGADRMDGGSGNDRTNGGSSADRINGGFGDDRLHGQSGKDRISGSRGRDRMNGGSSNDAISAGSSNDRVAGDQGNDRMNGNSGNDSLKGNSGNDRIKGSTGRDRISGGGGRDTVDARDGRRGDRIACGLGRDRVVADGSDRVGRDCERVRRR